MRHLLGVRFEGDRLVLKPALYPHSPPVKADLRFRKGRLKLEITGAGPVRFAELDGRRIEPDPDGAIRLPADFAGGRVVLHAHVPVNPLTNRIDRGIGAIHMAYQ